MKTRCLVCCAAILGIGTATGFSQTPSNDSFSNRAVLSGNSVTFSGSLSNATLEGGEPALLLSPDPMNGSIWWTWTATASSPVIVSVSRDYSAGAVVSAALEAFSGTNLTSLQGLDYASFDVPAGRYLKFMAGAGSNYQFRVSGNWPGTLSAQLVASQNPVIVRQPESCIVSPYSSATFYVIAAGLPKPAYQWTFNGAALPGSTTPLLIVHSILTNKTGNYSVIVSNATGATESAVASLSVIDTNPVPIVTPLAPTNPSQFPFLLKGEPGRWYRFEVSTDLANWDPPFWSNGSNWFGRATNTVNTFSVIRTNQQKEYVRVALNALTDACVAQLKAMRAAQDLYAIESKMPLTATVTFDLIEPYYPGGILPYCPQDGTYMSSATITNTPTCSLSKACGHVYP